MWKNQASHVSVPYRAAYDYSRGKLVVPNDTELYENTLAVSYTAPAGMHLALPCGIESTEWWNNNKANLQCIPRSSKSSPNGQWQIYHVKKTFNLLARDKKTTNGIIQEIAIFERAKNQLNPDLPESGKGIKVYMNGYVAQGTLKPVKKTAESFVKFTENIFPHMPTKHDIVQSHMADCFLLASLIGVLSQNLGDEFITGMMQQAEDHTIVRLFDPRENLQPVYIKVPNQYHTINGKNQVRHKAMWVHIIEQAYAQLAYLGKDRDAFASFDHVYGLGGNADNAFSILTGTTSRTHLVPKSQNLDFSPYMTTLEIIADLLKSTEKERVEQGEKLFNEMKNENTIFENYAFSEVSKLAIAMSNYPKAQKQQYTMEDLITEYNAFALLHADLALLLKPFIEEKKIDLPGPIGTGIYSKQQNDFFEKINQALLQGRAIGAASRFSQDEQIEGLANAHLYTVIAVKESLDQGIYYKSIKLRNPWGDTGIEEHLFNPKLAVLDKNTTATELPEYWIEFTRFTQFFSGCAITDKSIMALTRPLSPTNDKQLNTQAIRQFENRFEQLITDDAFWMTKVLDNIRVFLKSEFANGLKIDIGAIYTAVNDGKIETITIPENAIAKSITQTIIAIYSLRQFQTTVQESIRKIGRHNPNPKHKLETVSDLIIRGNGDKSYYEKLVEAKNTIWELYETLKLTAEPKKTDRFFVKPRPEWLMALANCAKEANDEVVSTYEIFDASKIRVTANSVSCSK